MRLASKGMTKDGETFCMSCGASVEPNASRCEACYSQLEQEVKAFHCPRCRSVLEFGTQDCGKCGMKFKAKSVRPADAAEDERILEKLISYGRRGADRRPSDGQIGQTLAPPGLTPEEQAAARDLVGRMVRLAVTRGEISAEMSARLSNARERLARMGRVTSGEFPADDIEAELKAVAEDLSGADEIATSAGQLSDELLRAVSLPGIEGLLKDRDLASIARGLSRRPSGATSQAILEREEQVRKREEMVDRKIRAYAQKKKQLEAMEAHMAAGASPQAISAPVPETPKGLVDKVRSVHEIISSDGACDDIEPCLESLERHLRGLVSARSTLEQRVAQLEEGEEEVRRLLKVLDNLLGQLPPDIVEGFSKSDEFRLYERVLDRLGV